VSAKKTDISQMQTYLNRELDSKAMHRIEREAQNDPFLMDALEGYEAVGNDQQANLNELQQRLGKRVETKKERNIILWRILPIAACLLIALTVGYWYFAPKPVKQQLVINALQGKIMVQPPVQQPIIEEAKPGRIATKHKDEIAQVTSPVTSEPKELLSAKRETIPEQRAITYKTDTVEYKASDYKVRDKSTVDELLKKMEGFEVNADGSVTHMGQAVTKARLSGKDYAGGDMAKAIQSLPADIVEKIQVIDDYGDQASKAGVKGGDPTKILNITADSSKKKLIAVNKTATTQQLKEVPINNSLAEVVVTGYGMQKKSMVTGAAATTITPSQLITPIDTVPAKEARPSIGREAYNKYLNENAVAIDGKTGTVRLAFLVGPAGAITNMRVQKGLSNDADKKAISLILTGPKWIRGTNGKETILKIIFHKK